MTKATWIGVGAAVLVVGGIGSYALGSRPEAPTGGPLEPCGPYPMCARVRAFVAAPPETVRAAARTALEDDGATNVAAAGAGWTAEAPIGLFVDDVQVAVEPDGAGSALWIRSTARVGRSDLGVNARRARRLVAAVQRIAG